MRFPWRVLLFVSIFAIEASVAVVRDGNVPPVVGDSAEVHNIAYNLAHGRWYKFDWNDQRWRALWQTPNNDGRFDFIVFRTGSYPTMFRPPLMPVLVAGILGLFPNNSFVAWRIFDSAAFAVAACLLCDVTFVHGGTVGLVAMLALLLGEPVRRQFVPGWWTEGLAFDLVSCVVWLAARGSRIRDLRYVACAGVVLGLLCLDRPVFVLVTPIFCLALAAAHSRSTSAIFKMALGMLLLSILVQAPWFARNIAVSGRMLPMGTQGGYNAPDDYGDLALANRGSWTGQGILNAWLPPSGTNSLIAIPPGYTKESFGSLWSTGFTDLRYGALIYAAVCTSLQSEIAVSDAGQQAATAWLRVNYSKVPKLMVEKAITLTRFERPFLAAAAALCMVGFFYLPELRITILCMGLLIAGCVLSVMLTHVVFYRFLIPLLPPLYTGVALGFVAIARLRRLA